MSQTQLPCPPSYAAPLMCLQMNNFILFLCFLYYFITYNSHNKWTQERGRVFRENNNSYTNFHNKHDELSIIGA